MQTEVLARLRDFLATQLEPRAAEVVKELAENRERGVPFAPLQTIERLKRSARSAGLWNMFLPRTAAHPERLSNEAYAPVCEIMGHYDWAPEVFNCSAPDTGNMETLELYGDEVQQRRWLTPLLAGEIRSAFLMTEPDVASSDATNIETSARREGDELVIRGRKWWSTGAMHANCKLFIVLAQHSGAATRHERHSMILVPADAKGVRVVRPLTAFGYDDAPYGHAEVQLEDVRVPVSNLLLGEGRGFEIAQGRLGPGRVHHCMRSIGAAEYALHAMCKRLDQRVTFGQRLSEQSLWHERIAEARSQIDQARLLVLETARRMDQDGNRSARKQIAMIKYVVPDMAARVLDWAIQAYGAAGVSGDFPLASMYAHQRGLRIADGPDEVHRRTVALMELKRAREN